MPFTFSVDGDKMTIVEGIRENWKPQGVEVIEHMVPYFNEITVRPPKLANAFVTREIPYSWEKGRTETLQIWEAYSQALHELSALIGIFT